MRSRTSPAVGIRHGPQQLRQRFRVDQAGQRFDVDQGFTLFRGRQRVDNGVDGAGPQRDQFFPMPFAPAGPPGLPLDLTSAMSRSAR